MLAMALSANGYSQMLDTLSQKEIQGIVYMREEEKLARDIYDSLYAKWKVNPFGNIRKSEQVHMDRVEELIEYYKLKDPLTESKGNPGVFLNNSLQKYYSELINSGNQSLIEALKVGAKIEELDISDLNSYLAGTNNENISETYSYLKMASENHLRAFVRRLRQYGINYSPVILNSREFQTIINTENKTPEKCNKDKVKGCQE